MDKLIIISVSLAAVLGTTQVYAQTSECQHQIAQAEGALVAITDSQKSEVQKDIKAAKDMMAKNDEKGCMAQMDKVRDQMLKLRKGQEAGGD